MSYQQYLIGKNRQPEPRLESINHKKDNKSNRAVDTKKEAIDTEKPDK